MNDMEVNASPIVPSVEETICRHDLLHEGDSVLVGLSGGPDSTCLLLVLAALQEKYGLKLAALYVDHMLRPGETRREADACKELCKRNSVPFHVRSIDVPGILKEGKGNRQEIARELRYRMFATVADETGASKIAVGHTADDQAETLIMRMLRGSGPAGLAGMPIKRGRIIRPLLETERGAIEHYLLSSKVGYVIDSSNLKKGYTRNRIRMTIMEDLKKINPNVVRTIGRTLTILQEEERYFDIQVAKALMKMISRKSEKRIELFLSPMETMDPVLLRRVLRRAIEETDSLRGISFIHVEDLIGLIRQGNSGDRIYLPRGIRAIKDYALLIITSEQPARIGEYEIEPPGEIALRGAGLVMKASFVQAEDETCNGTSSVLADAERLRFPLKVRPRARGDFFFPRGFGRRKKLQDFFVDEKVPRDERDAVPIVLSGDDIVWVAGYRADDRFAVTGQTKKIVRLAIVKGNF